MAKYGYDLSAHQGNLDLSALTKRQGDIHPAEFVILRAGYAGWGDPAVSYKDEQFENYYAQAKKLGLAVGAYFYAPCLTVEQAKSEAKAFASYLAGKQLDLPVYMDVEDGNNGQITLSADTITAMVKAFCDVMESQGYFAGVYSTKYLLENKVKTNDYTKWVAAWGNNSGSLEFLLENYPMHQFTSMSLVDGHRLDKNILYDESLISLIRQEGFNGYGKTQPPKTVTYIVKSGDTLSEIAEKYSTTTAALVKANRIQNANLIYPGQVLTIV